SPRSRRDDRRGVAIPDQLSRADRVDGVRGDRRPPRRRLPVDVGAGIVSSTIANVNRGKKGRRFKPDDFTPSWGGRNRRRRPQTPEEQLAVVRGINAALGGTVRKREEA